MPWLLIIAALLVIFGLPTLLKIVGVYLLLTIGIPVLVLALVALWAIVFW